MPRQYQLSCIPKIDDDVARFGNMQELRHLRVLQKVRSETNCRFDLRLKSLELQDLNQLLLEESKSNDPYFRNLTLNASTQSIHASMYSINTLRTVGPGKISRTDATGNCCAHPSYWITKRILYYAFVVYVCK